MNTVHDEHSPNVTSLLKEIVVELKAMREQLPSKQQSKPETVAEDDKVDAELKEQEEAWELAVDTLKKREKDITDSWKDELNNLLVFTGLFSAIVTAFTVVSFTWLQQDPGDATNILLANISLQLSHFIVSPGHVNSSAPFISLQNATSSFVPSSYAVPVNVLWVLSLTLSLTSAFFAIAVQQWLRQLQLPPEIPLRKAAQLLWLRYDGLQAWQVPGIISLLPLLLQIAVVLFLAGLFLLFRALNDTVTIVFGIAASFALVVFLAMTLGPLTSPRCPYKSPLIPTVITTLQWVTYPLTPLPLCILYILQSFWELEIIRCWLRQHRSISTYYHRYIYFPHHNLLGYVKSFGRHMLVGNISQFWILRECRHISNLDNEDSSTLDGPPLLDVFLLISNASVPNVLRCLHDIDSFWPFATFMQAGERCIATIASRRWDNIRYTYTDHRRPLATRARSFKVWDIQNVAAFKQWLSIRHCRLGLNILRHHLGMEACPSPTSGMTLYLLNGLSKVFKELRASLARYLVHLCAHQPIHKFRKDWRSYSADPLEILLEIIGKEGLSCYLDPQDLQAFMVKCSDLNHQSCSTESCDWNAVEVCLAYSASACTLMVARPAIFDVRVIASLDHFFQDEQRVAVTAKQLENYYPDTDENISLPFMLQAICNALAAVTGEHMLGLADNIPNPPLPHLTRALHRICRNLGEDDKAKAVESLRTFERIKGKYAPQRLALVNGSWGDLLWCLLGGDENVTTYDLGRLF